MIFYSGNFLPFGTLAGDALVPVALDGSTDVQVFSVPFRFFESNETDIFVSISIIIYRYCLCLEVRRFHT